MKDSRRATRRRLLQFGAALSGGLLRAENTPGRLGTPLGPYTERSGFEKSARWTRPSKTPETGSSFSPLQDSVGTLTPSALHYERHHAGVPAIDPAKHQLVIHGMVERPLSLSVEEIKRLPSVSRILVLECGGNSGSEWAAKTAPDVQRSYGLASCSEWTGVPLSLLLAEVGVRPGASWVIAEGADACRMQRSIPLSKAQDNVLVAYGQNGEALRPSQGYPLRLLIPGWEGNTNVKWLHSLRVTSQPYMARDETSKYTDLMPDGKARIFTFQMEAKSVVTFPSGGQALSGPGLYELTGLAWSGRGRIERVEITIDGGRTWVEAALQEPRLPIAFTRFRLAWRWEGEEALIASRATDETGYVQPSREALIAVRGTNSGFHYNGIKLWKVHRDGTVTNVEV
ncbi:MAG TPA: sulfite dehydrogenase [Bryobacteraceae bacterium]|nr:sulfite dehydrogenase [Bryobacteraceae bacterium]